MNSISVYFGSGQQVVGHDPLEPVGDLADAVHRGDHLVAHVLRVLEALDSPGDVVGLLERLDARDELVDRSPHLGRPSAVHSPAAAARRGGATAAGRIIVRAIDAASRPRC